MLPSDEELNNLLRMTVGYNEGTLYARCHSAIEALRAELIEFRRVGGIFAGLFDIETNELNCHEKYRKGLRYWLTELKTTNIPDEFADLRTEIAELKEGNALGTQNIANLVAEIKRLTSELCSISER